MSSHIERAIEQIQVKQPIPEIDFTQHTLEDGNIISTQEHVVKDVQAPAMHIPTNEQFFNRHGQDCSKPDVAFLKNHFYHKGRLSEDQALWILETATDILRKEGNVLQVDAPITASLSHLAIGLGDGTVLLYRHLDQSLLSLSSLTSLPKPHTVHESPTEPITGLGFKEPTDNSMNLALFVVTTSHVLSYQVTGKGSGGSAMVVDEIGCGLGCATMDSKARDIVVARDEAIYVCGTEGRGACYAYEGHKSSIYTHLNYLVIVSPPFIPSASAASAMVRNFVARTANSGEMDITKVTILEPENKYVAYSGTFTNDVREIISQWGKIYILTSDGKLLCLQEKSTSAKLDMLYCKSLYTLALSLAKTQNLEESSVADIHRQYGDHLYTKGDYDGVMQQFVLTIGHLQPSHVIRKFLDAQRIHNLLKDVACLDSFIKAESKCNADNAGKLPFDLETAIRVCRQAGYFEHASYLTKKHERHEDYLRIQIEDSENYGDALTYLRKLGPEAAESNLARYGRAMLNSLPQETTQLLIDLCTSSGPLGLEAEEPASAVTTKPVAPAPNNGEKKTIKLRCLLLFTKWRQLSRHRSRGHRRSTSLRQPPLKKTMPTHL
ncbi:hypothetical protein BDZ94DRAFT_1324440 [Collybia nuda]|uniref:PEP5/VPS11 N-terminal domain-containing protein n=1 Tax=Collybia nuda TaxID=64659 RepID=A0A9P6CF62_9AGAR|nr:hypothetical protein BDZ94DRAFT_1324440 [Collybia nuda]